jgi:hypothetical protein
MLPLCDRPNNALRRLFCDWTGPHHLAAADPARGGRPALPHWLQTHAERLSKVLTNGCAWNAVSAFANCGRAVAFVRGSYVPEPAMAPFRVLAKVM